MGRLSFDLGSCISLEKFSLPVPVPLDITGPALNRRWYVPFVPLRRPAPPRSWLEEIKSVARWFPPVVALVGYGTLARSAISLNPNLSLEGLEIIGEALFLAGTVTALSVVKNLCNSCAAAKNTLKAAFDPGGLIYETALAPQILKRLWIAAREFNGLDLGLPIGR